MSATESTDGAWCTGCKARHPREAFGADRSRGRGFAASCYRHRKTMYERTYVRRGRPSRVGQRLAATRDGDKRQARARVNHEVEVGRRPHPNALPCADCGHQWSAGERRHEYDHHLGYGAAHQLDVQPVCTSCHRTRESRRRKGA